MSIHVLLARLRDSGADKVVFTPNAPVQAFQGDSSQELPGGPTSPASILDALGEVLSNADLAELPTSRPRIVRYSDEGTQYVLEVIRQPGGVAVAVRYGAARPPQAKPRTSRRFRPSQRMSPAPPADRRTPRSDPGASGGSFESNVVPMELDTRGGKIGAGRTRTPAPVVSIKPAAPPRIDELLREMIGKGASDLHLTSGSHPVLRVHGGISFLTDRPAPTSSDVASLVREIMTDKAKADFEAAKDADFAYEVPGLARFRVNVFEDRNGIGAVLRQIPIEILTAAQLGLPKACLDLCWLSKGLVVVTGPTGSGKSTTLAAMVDFINDNRSDHIITIEDPVEFVHKNKRCLVNQREVGHHTMSFKNALRAALREDPDIVLVGEMRDLETISIAIETAETGHLVFGTLHTTTAVSTVDRIIDQFPADRQAQIRVMLSESLKGVIAQVLLPKIGGGRVAAHEILLCNHAVSAMIRDGKTFQLPSVMQTQKGQGMVTLNDSLMGLVQRRLVEPKEAYLKAVDKTGLLSMFKNAGIPTAF